MNERAVLVDGCLSCDLLAGKKAAPGGVIHDGDHWRVLHQVGPVRYPGYLFVVLKRHCEHLADLTADEAASLGPTTRSTCQALRRALSPAPEKVYVCSFGEGVGHVHFHVIPRLPGVPGGIMPFFTHLELRRLLEEAGPKTWAEGDEEAAELTAALAPRTQALLDYVVRAALPRQAWTAGDDEAAGVAARVRQEFGQLRAGNRDHVPGG